MSLYNGQVSFTQSLDIEFAVNADTLNPYVHYLQNEMSFIMTQMFSYKQTRNCLSQELQRE